MRSSSTTSADLAPLLRIDLIERGMLSGNTLQLKRELEDSKYDRFMLFDLRCLLAEPSPSGKEDGFLGSRPSISNKEYHLSTV